MVGGVAAFLFSILVFLPAFHPDGVWGYGLSSEDKPVSPDALTQKVKVVVMLILTSGVVGLTSPWLLVVLPTLAWRFLGSVDFYWVWDNWHYNVTLMPIALGALLDVVARRRARGAYATGRPIREVGVDGLAVPESSPEAAEDDSGARAAGVSAVDIRRWRPVAFPTWLTVPLRHRYVAAVSILTVVATGVLTAPYLPLWKATDQNFNTPNAETKKEDPEARRVSTAREVIATIPAGVLGGAATVLYGMIGMLGVRIWVQNRVDFSDPVNLNTAAVSMVVAIANYTLAWNGMTFEGIALGSVAAIGIYHVMRWISKLRGTNLEQASPASAPAGTELEGPAYSSRAAHSPSAASPGAASTPSGPDGDRETKGEVTD